MLSASMPLAIDCPNMLKELLTWCPCILWGWKEKKQKKVILGKLIFELQFPVKKFIYIFFVTGYIVTGYHRLCKKFLKSFTVPQMVWVLIEGKTLSNLNLRFFWIDYFSLKKRTCENDGVIPSSLPLYI